MSLAIYSTDDLYAALSNKVNSTQAIIIALHSPSEIKAEISRRFGMGISLSKQVGPYRIYLNAITSAFGYDYRLSVTNGSDEEYSQSLGHDEKTALSIYDNITVTQIKQLKEI